MFNITKVSEQNDELQSELGKLRKKYDALKKEKEDEIQKIKGEKDDAIKEKEKLWSSSNLEKKK